MKNKLFNAIPDLMLFGMIVGSLYLGAVFPEPKLVAGSFTYIIGGGLIIVGLCLGFLVMTFMISRGGSTDVVKTSERLITQKYFRISRNPLYLAELMVLGGVAALTGGLLAFAGPVVYFIVINFVIIPYEERYLKRTFGSAYEKYKMSTRRWI